MPEDPERRELLVQLVDDLELLLEAFGVEPVRDRQPTGVVGEHHVLVPEVDGRLGHLLDGRATVGPVRVGVAVAAQRRPDVGSFAHLDRRGFLELGEVGRRLPLERVADHLACALPDVRELFERSFVDPLLQLGGR
jgi:hypothetical protein